MDSDRTRIVRYKFARPNVFRYSAEITGEWYWPNTSKYMPHQGNREKNRRMRKMGLEPSHGFIKINTGGVKARELNITMSGENVGKSMVLTNVGVL